MVENWKMMIEGMNEAIGNLHRASPEVMKTFSAMGHAAHAGSALDRATKELIALAIGVATRCAPCIAYHVEGALKAGASPEAVAETLGIAVYMGAGPSVMYAAQAWEAAEQLKPHTA